MPESRKKRTRRRDGKIDSNPFNFSKNSAAPLPEVTNQRTQIRQNHNFDQGKPLAGKVIKKPYRTTEK